MVEVLTYRSAVTVPLHYLARDLLAKAGLRATQPHLSLTELLFG